MASSKVPIGAATQVATFGVGASVAAGAATRSTLVHILAAPKGLVKVKAGWTDAFEASQSVVAGRGATGGGARTFILICEQKETAELSAQQFPIHTVVLTRSIFGTNSMRRTEFWMLHELIPSAVPKPPPAMIHLLLS